MSQMMTSRRKSFKSCSRGIWFRQRIYVEWRRWKRARRDNIRVSSGICFLSTELTSCHFIPDSTACGFSRKRGLHYVLYYMNSPPLFFSPKCESLVLNLLLVSWTHYSGGSSFRSQIAIRGSMMDTANAAKEGFPQSLRGSLPLMTIPVWACLSWFAVAKASLEYWRDQWMCCQELKRVLPPRQFRLPVSNVIFKKKGKQVSSQ